MRKANPVRACSPEHWQLVKTYFDPLVKLLMSDLDMSEEELRPIFRSIKPQHEQNNCWLNVLHSPHPDQVNEVEIVEYKLPARLEVRLKYIQKLYNQKKKQEVAIHSILEFNDFTEMLANEVFRQWFGYRRSSEHEAMSRFV